MANKVGPLIKEARTSAGMTQEQLAKKIKGITAADISKAERGEREFTQAVLKEIAKYTGVTQSSLINAAKESTYKSASKSTASKSPSASKSSSGTSVKVTAAEKKLLELYRAADADTKKAAVNLLKGESSGLSDIIGSLLGGSSSGKGDLLGTLLDGTMDALGKK